MALTTTQWADDLRATIAQLVGAMRHIQNMETQAEWKPYFDGWMKDSTISKDTRKTIKNLLPAVMAMSDDMGDLTLAELGINTSSLPTSSPFSANNDLEPPVLKIAQMDMTEKPSETAHAVLMLTKAGRTVQLSIYDMAGIQILPPKVAVEILAGVFVYQINWSQLAVSDGYYIVHAEDGFQLDAKEVEIKSLQNQTHTQADKVWMLQNVSAKPPKAKANGGFI